MEIPFLTNQKKSGCSRALFEQRSWANRIKTYQQTKTRWWFQTLFAYHPICGQFPFLTAIFCNWVEAATPRKNPHGWCIRRIVPYLDFYVDQEEPEVRTNQAAILFRLLKVGKGMEIQTWRDIDQYYESFIIMITLRLYHSFSSFFIPS